MTLLTSVTRSQTENICNYTDSVMLDAKCIRMLNFATEISKISGGIAPEPSCWGGATYVPCVLGESEGDCFWRGSRRSVGSSFHRRGAAYWKERLVILRVDRVGGRARLIIDEERVLQLGWTEIKLWRYWGWLDVRTLYVRERSLYNPLYIEWSELLHC